MPKRITPTHKPDAIQTPTQQAIMLTPEDGEASLPAVVEQHTELDCPNEDRITTIERRLRELGENQLTPVASNDEHTDQRLNAIMRQVENLRSQVETISQEAADAPKLSQSDVEQLLSALNTRVPKMIEEAISKEVTQIKIRMSSIERTSAPSLAQDVEQLGRIVTETGKLVASMDERSRGFEAYVEESRQAFKNLRKEFYGDLAAVMGRVVDNFQEAS